MRYTSRLINKLTSIIQDAGIQVNLLNRSCIQSNAKCYGKNQHINLGTKGKKWLVLAALAHEYGHCVSVRKDKALEQGTVLLYGIGVVLGKKQATAIIKEERRAWRLGFKLLRDNGIVVDDAMLHAREVLVGTHVKNMKKCIPQWV